MARIKPKATKDNKAKTLPCFPPHLQLQKSLLQFISLWKELFTAAHGKYLASKWRREAGKNVYSWILPKKWAGQSLTWFSSKNCGSSPAKRGDVSCAELLTRETTAAPPRPAAQAGPSQNLQHPPAFYLWSWSSPHTQKKSIFPSHC